MEISLADLVWPTEPVVPVLVGGGAMGPKLKNANLTGMELFTVP